MTSEEKIKHYKIAVKSVISVCVAFAFYNISDAIVKELGSKFHFSQIFFSIYIVLFIIIALYGWKTEGKKAFKTKKIKSVTIYSFLVILTIFLNIKALPNIPLTSFYTIIFTSPLWVALLSAFFLKDKLSKERLGVILFGFLVIVFIYRPWNGNFTIWSLIVFANAFIGAATMVLLRHIGTSESKSFIMMSASFWAVIFSFPFLWGNYIEPNLWQYGLFFTNALVLAFAGLFIIYGFQHAPSAALVAPYQYTQIIWGALIGYFVFKEVPNIETIIGASLIILSGLYLIYSEKKNSKPIKKNIKQNDK